ncbi:MAG: cation transporter dimerization domain-containing protein, partial [Bacteroidales bacterium]|nr:cation transporter dimerization domain-containing protein [Bacteroidales bacterium]
LLMKQASDELLEKSLPKDIEQEIISIVEEEEGVTGIHNLRTRRIGSLIAMEMHLRMPGDTLLYVAHQHTSRIERRLRQRFGKGTLISIHVEPIKVEGRYVAPHSS